MCSVVSKTLVPVLAAVLVSPVAARAQCSVNTVIVSGRVDHANAHASVRVRLVYPKRKPGESGEVTVEEGSFRIPVEYVTQQSSILTNLPPRCGRKPQTVVVSLLENGQQSDEVSLDFLKSFKMADASAYALRSELVLHGSQ